jgi:hypothetical protein
LCIAAAVVIVLTTGGQRLRAIAIK